jgi:hypothetical protein
MLELARSPLIGSTRIYPPSVPRSGWSHRVPRHTVDVCLADPLESLADPLDAVLSGLLTEPLQVDSRKCLFIHQLRQKPISDEVFAEFLRRGKQTSLLLHWTLTDGRVDPGDYMTDCV